MTASIDGRGQRIDYTRDILGRVTKKTPVGRAASEIVTYAWDSAGLSGSYGKTVVPYTLLVDRHGWAKIVGCAWSGSDGRSQDDAKGRSTTMFTLRLSVIG